MAFKSISHLEAWVPRGLVVAPSEVVNAKVSAEGLLPLRIEFSHGLISRIEPINKNGSLPKHLLLPRFVEPHAHLDKAFTWTAVPNLKGTYEEALAANLNEHQSRTSLLVSERAELSLQRALSNGVRALRSHVDCLWPDSAQSWELLKDLKRGWREKIDLQWVALAPVEYWSSSEGNHLARRLANFGGLLGGVLVPSLISELTCDHLKTMIEMANNLGCGIDIHIDESDKHPAHCLKQLLSVLDSMTLSVPITCSHLSSLGLLPSERIRYFAHKIASHRLSVVALPLTNGWLLGRRNRKTPVMRPLAPIKQLQQAGVNVAVGGDNVQDAWFPAGNFDPLALMAICLPLAQLAPWERLGLAPFTTAAARLMDLSWDGTLNLQSPADIVLLEAKSWAEALASPPSRKVMIRGEWI